MSDVAALLAERAGYVVRGRMDRVAQVDAVLATFGVAVGEDEADETPEIEPETPEVETTEAEPDVEIETPETKPARSRRS